VVFVALIETGGKDKKETKMPKKKNVSTDARKQTREIRAYANQHLMSKSTGIAFLLNPELPELSQLPHSLLLAQLLPFVLVLLLLALLLNTPAPAPDRLILNSLRDGEGVVAGDDDENLSGLAVPVVVVAPRAVDDVLDSVDIRPRCDSERERDPALGLNSFLDGEGEPA
jgi:hypothetical protein